MLHGGGPPRVLQRNRSPQGCPRSQPVLPPPPRQGMLRPHWVLAPALPLSAGVALGRLRSVRFLVCEMPVTAASRWGSRDAP